VYYKFNILLPRDAMPKRGLCYRPVCLSVRLSCSRIASSRLKISSNFLSQPGSPIIPVSEAIRCCPIPNRGAKYTAWRKIEIFDWNRHLSRKRYEICSWLLGSHRSPIDPCRFRWPWVTLKGGTRGSNTSGGSLQ